MSTRLCVCGDGDVPSQPYSQRVSMRILSSSLLLLNNNSIHILYNVDPKLEPKNAKICGNPHVPFVFAFAFTQRGSLADMCKRVLILDSVANSEI